MDKELKQKINRLLNLWPNNAIMTTHHLSKMGYYAQLVKRYCDSGWIKKVGQGAYSKLNDPVELTGALYALQEQLQLPVHLGGLSALEHHGLAQYLAMNTQQDEEWLFNTTDQAIKLPTWFKQTFFRINYTNQHLFSQEVGLEKILMNQLPIMVSTPERAILEVLVLVPSRFSYVHAYELMENLQLLRPKLLNKLLKVCLSIKVKRLFLYLADKHQLSCSKHLNKQTFDLGKGKRMIGEGGQYIAEYQISVPVVKTEDESGVGYV